MTNSEFNRILAAVSVHAKADGLRVDPHMLFNSGTLMLWAPLRVSAEREVSGDYITATLGETGDVELELGAFSGVGPDEPVTDALFEPSRKSSHQTVALALRELRNLGRRGSAEALLAAREVVLAGGASDALSGAA